MNGHDRDHDTRELADRKHTLNYWTIVESLLNRQLKAIFKEYSPRIRGEVEDISVREGDNIPLKLK